MFRAIRNTRSLRKVALIVMLAGVSGCTLNTDVSGPAGMAKYSGDPQSAATNTTLPTPLAVIVFSQFGEPVENVTVTWTITSGGGTLSPTAGGGGALTMTTQTNDLGITSVNYTTGSTAGSAAIQARVSGLPALTFNITIT
jgi:hypothetical protein